MPSYSPWLPGQEAGHAIADILSGQENPCGKLPTTFAVSLDDYPSMQNFPGVVLEEAQPKGREFDQVVDVKAAEVVYDDSIWVGYRAFNTRKQAHKQARRPSTAYPFGFGLSYTTFQYDDLRLSSQQFCEQLQIDITVTNTGAVAGKEVVQLYIAAPEGGLVKPAMELKAFAKTRLLQAGESQTLIFELTERDLASFDPDANHWVVAAGDYRVNVGASSEDIRCFGIFAKSKPSTLPLLARNPTKVRQ